MNDVRRSFIDEQFERINESVRQAITRFASRSSPTHFCKRRTTG